MLLINRGYPCRHFFQVIVFSLAAKFLINFVAKRWLLEKYQDEDLGMQPLVNLSTVFLSESSKVSTPTTILPSNESSTRKAINIAIEKDDLNVLKFLKTYILQNNCSLVKNTTNASASGHKTSYKRSTPKTAYYQSALENQSSKAQEKQSKSVHGPGTNTCGKCSSKGHNHQWHAKHVNKACDSTIMCEFCGGHGYKKELHDYNNMENESEWIGSSSLESDSEMDTDK
ncbi:protein far1-related sequence 5-like [Gigaspora margarita]|uniref:Protein far1-related sequence 5-like n=1 Tax=Gigaspora margarita TaxID=4874 RepID=A0A8H3X065_GIGMA|nr:protein far1-related sequence 5-like [Gigaspora margarita]